MINSLQDDSVLNVRLSTGSTTTGRLFLFCALTGEIFVPMDKETTVGKLFNDNNYSRGMRPLL